MRIAICEDNTEHAEILKKMIKRWAERQNHPVDMGYYRSAEEFMFLTKEDGHYDLAFLDIRLGNINGMELAKYIRKKDRTILLVFITGEKGYALSGYEVSAFRYLMKPLQEKDVSETLTKANQMLEANRKDAVIVTYNDESRRIKKEDVCYVEVDNHHIILHMKDETVRFKARLKDWEQQFQEPRFCKCHRSYLVNLHYVGKISRKGVEIENGDLLPVSRAHWDDLNRCYMGYYTMR